MTCVGWKGSVLSRAKFFASIEASRYQPPLLKSLFNPRAVQLSDLTRALRSGKLPAIFLSFLIWRIPWPFSGGRSSLRTSAYERWGEKGLNLNLLPRPRLQTIPSDQTVSHASSKEQANGGMPREPSPRNIWCLAPILGVFVKGGACENRPPRGHRLVSRKEKLRGKNS